MEDQWMQWITLDSLPDQYREIAEEIGIENFLKLVKLYGGDELYLPNYDFFIRPVRNQMIREEYNGFNRHELARKYKLNERTIRQIVKDVG
ncbi:Mor transcription activator family protein [Paenibacillus sp. oral taxon 786 str. D14]|uniref:Mor transcription activator family protein n=1 Tax=Paenibacillus sp. oral taxon 786 TaxID=652715 RepID=UPI0001AFCD6B|nr:Mor transcription activator family protein [Paenibacillus sp. oral taxon 786]EES74609.1 Mor transcription activator family protein [Paenibacillus sp. oral taxon 786 str. D14]